jgi:hypothetical protein
MVNIFDATIGVEDPLLTTLDPYSASMMNKIILNLFPNPAREFVNLEFMNLTAGQLSVSVTNLQGEEIFTSQISVIEPDYSYRLETGSLSKGLYIVSVLNEGIVLMDKFIKLE